jgi:hypothetical protein
MRVRQSGPVRASTGFEWNRNARPSALLQRNGLCRFGGNRLTIFARRTALEPHKSRPVAAPAKENELSDHHVAGVNHGCAECHGARLVRSSPHAGCSAVLRPDGDRAAFRGRGRGSGRRAFRPRFRRPAARRTKGWDESSGWIGLEKPRPRRAGLGYRSHFRSDQHCRSRYRLQCAA